MGNRTVIIDAFMWSYEYDAVKIRLATLGNTVDKHVAVQATNTFRGKPREVRKLDLPNVIDVIVTIPEGLDPWESEMWLRDSVLIEANKLYPDAIYIVSDGDEIPHPAAILAAGGKPTTLLTDYRNFYADWRGVLKWQPDHQPVIGRIEDYEDVGGASNARWYAQWPKSNAIGWHLSSLGGDEMIREKLETFAHSEFDDEAIKSIVPEARNNRKDFLNRFDLEYTEDIPKGVPPHLLGGAF